MNDRPNEPIKPGGPQRPPPGGNNKNNRPRVGFSSRTWWVIIGAWFLFNIIFYGSQMSLGNKQQSPQTTLSYSTLVQQIGASNIKTANVEGDSISGDFKHAYTLSHKSYSRYTATVTTNLQSSVVTQLQKHGAQVTLASTTTPVWVTLLAIVLQGLPFLLLIGLFYFGTRAARSQQQGVFGFGQSRAKRYTEESPRITFNDVAGVEPAKDELREIVDFLRDPSKYHRLGARIPKGVLLVGPPGTGKTLLARAVAGEAHVPFFSISSSEFVELFVGVGASRVRDLFERAKAVAPAIVFVDEIDAIGGRRSGGGPLPGGNDEREQTLNQLLTEMDGFEPNQSVIVVGATNRPDVLDPALLRPGRFDRQVVLDPPDKRGRESILRIHSRNIPLASSVDLEAVAQATPGMTGADLANLCNEAALNAARHNESEVQQHDFDEALDRITLGTVGSALINEEERRTVAYHEGGHTLVALILPGVDPVHRVTIVPRGRSLGVTQFRPIDDRRNYRRDYLVNRMAVGMGGRAAEEVAIGEITSGAQNDLQQVTRVARSMVTQLGMSETLPPGYFGNSGDDSLNGGSYNPWEPKQISDETANKIDQAVFQLVNEAHETALRVLQENQEALKAIADALIQEESLDREELTAIVNQHRLPNQPQLAIPTGPPTPVVDSTVPVAAVSQQAVGDLTGE